MKLKTFLHQTVVLYHDTVPDCKFDSFLDFIQLLWLRSGGGGEAGP